MQENNQVKPANNLLAQKKALEAQLQEQQKAIDALQDINEEYASINEELKVKNTLLHESEEKFRSLFEQSFDLIFLHDLQGNIVDVNQSVIHHYGYTKEELIVLGIPGLDHDYAEREQGGDFWDAFDFNKSIRFEARHIKKNKAITFLEVGLSKIRIQDKTYIMGVCRDISERKKTEKKMLEAQEKLKEAKTKAEEGERLKSVFLSNLSHEVRTPMNGIMGFAELLALHNENLDEDSRHYIQLIQLCGNQLLRMIDDLLDISRLEAGDLELTYSSTDLHDILMQLYETHLDDPSIDQHKKQLIFKRIPHPAQMVLLSDNERLRQMLDNLINNAIKFTRSGQIVVDFSIRGDELVFSVKDTGIGIAQEDHLKIFKMFRQAQESTDRIYGGSGLGLAIVKSLVVMMDGDVWLESEVNQGTTFYLSIPYIKKNAPSEERKNGDRTLTESTPDWSTKSILLVEDNLDSMELLETILLPTNIQISKASDGEEALALYEKEKPNLILLDIQIPSINGIEVARKIREKDQQTIMVAQSAYTLKNDINKAKDAGCNDYLAKPIIIKDIMQVLSKYLN